MCDMIGACSPAAIGFILGCVMLALISIGSLAINFASFKLFFSNFKLNLGIEKKDQEEKVKKTKEPKPEKEPKDNCNKAVLILVGFGIVIMLATFVTVAIMAFR